MVKERLVWYNGGGGISVLGSNGVIVGEEGVCGGTTIRVDTDIMLSDLTDVAILVATLSMESLLLLLDVELVLILGSISIISFSSSSFTVLSHALFTRTKPFLGGRDELSVGDV